MTAVLAGATTLFRDRDLFVHDGSRLRRFRVSAPLQAVLFIVLLGLVGWASYATAQLLTELCEHTREDAFSRAVEHAWALGANSLVAIRYDATEILPGVSEVLCYGTALRIAPRIRGADES